MGKVKIGLEIHQQLDTHKLFCECESRIIDDFDKAIVFERALSLSESEIGEIDPAAVYESRKKRVFKYIAPPHVSCLVEMDEEPPHNPNKEAILITLQFAKLVNARVVDKLFFMRKIVIDGSNTTGFQRTGLVAINGNITIDGKNIPIETICLEEDSARIINSGKNGEITFCLDRQGVPLIELATAPVISSPIEARKVAEELGLLLRSLKVKRGLGTIRQDLNINIEGFPRIEIKGVQDLKNMEKIVSLEIERQKKLLSFSKKAPEILKDNIINITKLFTQKKEGFFSKFIKKGLGIYARRIRNYKGLLGYEILPNKRIATEMSDYIKSVLGVGGLIHGDEMPGYGLNGKDLERLYKVLKIGEKDNFIIVIEKEEKAKKAINYAIERLKQLKMLEPEVRKANSDGTTTYMRPLPGAARMYPETDVEPVILYGIEIEKPETLREKMEEYIKIGLDKKEALIILKEGIDVRDLYKRYKVHPKTIFSLLFSIPKTIIRELNLDNSVMLKLNKELQEEIISLFHKNKINKKGVESLIKNYFKTGIWNPKEFLEYDDKKMMMELEKIAKKTSNIKEAMRIVSSYEGKINPKKAMEFLKKKLS